jgi:general secretion pathway protein B
MSFILDALKKSESERQRQTGPALFEVRIAPPRPRFPLWAILVAALLAVNALVFGGWLIVRSARTEAISAGTPVAVATPPAAGAAGAATAATARAPAPIARRPSEPRDPELAALDPAADPASAAGVARPDDEPAAPAGVVTSAGAGSQAATAAEYPGVRVQSEALPTRDELHSPAIAALPELRLDLHVYDAIPAKRFVLINMHRLREGDSLPEGVRVDHITPEGAELEYQGEHFLLPRE